MHPKIMRRLVQAGLAALLVTGSGAAAAPASAVPGSITFPLRASKSVIESQSPRWCFWSQNNCHHHYNAADIFAPTGTPVVSPVSGTVIRTTVESSGVGSRVQIRDADGDIWYLAHMHHSPGLAVTQGQNVAPGTVIGYVGTSAHAAGTPPHLHIDMLPPPYTSRPSCSGAACTAHPFANLQPLLVAAFNSAGPVLPWRPWCYPVSGDWDGNRSVTIGVACKEGEAFSWGLMNANVEGPPQVPGLFGNANPCLPLTGDWDGDGHDTIGTACKVGNVIRWNLINAFRGSPSYPVFDFGNADSCWPVTGDWDGNGTDTAGIACKEGEAYKWGVVNHHGGGSPQDGGLYGNANSCHPVVGDWNGDGRDTAGTACKVGDVIRWGLINAFQGTPSYPVFDFGNAHSCRPVTGDWDGNRTSTIGITCYENHAYRWGLMNHHGGGTPPVKPLYGFADSYQYSGGWAGPASPTWPTA